jgi:hypothetical protein
MDDQPSPLLAEILGGVSDAMIEDAAGYAEDPLSPAVTAELESTPLAVDPASAISRDAHEFIVRWETGGKPYYETVIKGRPIWPGFSSGITIGCGFDLGYHTAAEFEAEWGSRLRRADFDRLRPTIGFKTVAPGREAKVARARSLVASLADIVVPWTVAIEQFETTKLPKLVRQLYGALDNLDRLHPHCRGALLSLVFNRGPSFRADGDRYVEMRKIRAAMTTGTRAAFATIPAELRAMKRIWGAASSLAERREGEAKLFEAGLREAGLLESLATLEEAAGAETALESGLGELHGDVEAVQTDVADEDEILRLESLAGLEATGPTVDDVRWNPRDDEQPDYRHLDTSLAGTRFTLTRADIETLIEANDFAVKPGKVILALRGARLVAGEVVENAGAVEIVDQRPDHATFRCVIGVYDRAARTFTLYRASTVPNRAYVLKCFSMARAGTAMRDLTGNILPTGCYTYTVGTHRPGQPRSIPGVLRLSTTASGASSVVVLRSLGDVVYDRFDAFPIATPGDNIHPAILSTGFSSAGCLTIPGIFEGGQHKGRWGEFRRAAGLGADGQQFSCILVTGLDAALAVRARTDGSGAGTIRRLRHGSEGARVDALQRALGLATDQSRLFGPVTRDALVKRQQRALGWADGIYAPAMDGLLGFNVYGTA